MHQNVKGFPLRSNVVAAAMAAALCATLAACAPEPMPVPTVTPTATPLPAGDGVLTIGTLFPTTGATTFLARAQDAGVELAVREINEAGGVNGKPVVVYHRDSGDASTTKAEASLEDLISKNVDVVIGPSSSILAERLLPTIVAEGIAMISPSATSPALSSLKDQGLLFRTIPSAALEGSALADVAGKDRTVALVYYSDDTGRAVHASVEAGLDRVGGTLVVSESFSETINPTDRIIAAVTKAEPDVVILASPFSAMAKNKTIINGLVNAKFGGSKLWLTSQNLADYSQELSSNTLKDANGILEGAVPDDAFMKRVKSADPAVSDYRYAAEAYDATILAALAAIVAGNDTGWAVAGSLQAVSASGIKCTSFGECLDALKTRSDIDYDGISGPITFDDAGDPRSATYGLFRYGADNRFKLVGTTVAG